MPTPPNTLPADFFSKQQQNAPDTLPADFFSGKESIDYNKPPSPSNVQRLSQVPRDLLEGVGAGAASTAVGAYDLVRKAPGADKVLPEVSPALRQATQPPDYSGLGWPGKTGKFVEQTAEFMAPAGLIGKGAAAVKAATAGRRGATALNTAARAGMEGASAAGVAGVQTGGNAPEAQKAGLTAGGISAVSPVVGSAVRAAAPMLEKSAAGNYLSVLLPGSKRLVPKAEETAAMMAKEKPLALTQQGLLDKARVNRTASGPVAAAAYVGKPPVSPQQILADLDALEAKHVNVKGSNVQVNPGLKNALDGLRQNITDMQDSFGNIAAESLDDFRDKLYRGVVDAMGAVRQNSPATAKAIETSAASSIRRVLDDKFPDAKKLNDTYKLWANAETFLEDARRRGIASKSGIITGSSQGFGALTQRMLPRPVRELPQTITGFFDSVAWNTVSGATKQALAEAIAGRNWKLAEAMLSALAPKVGASSVVDRDQSTPQFAKGGVVKPKRGIRHSRRGIAYGPPKLLRQKDQGPPKLT